MENRAVAGVGAEGSESLSECHTRQQEVHVVDSTPTNWFELGAELCYEGRVSKDRLEKAFEAVRLGVARA